MEKLITVKKVSEMLGLRPWTIRNFCRSGKIPCYKVSGTYRFKKSEIEKWLEDRKQKVIKNFMVDVIR